MLQYLPALHDSDDGGLEVHLAVFVDGVVGLLHLLRSLALDGARDPELGALVAIAQVQGDDGLGAQLLGTDVTQMRNKTETISMVIPHR